MFHLSYDHPRYDELELTIRRFAAEFDDDGLRAFLTAEQISSFRLRDRLTGDIYNEFFWTSYYPFGCFSDQRALLVPTKMADPTVKETGANHGVLNSWLYGIFHYNMMSVIIVQPALLDMLRAVKLEMAGNTLGLIVERFSKTTKRLATAGDTGEFMATAQQLIDLLGCYFIDRGTSPHYYLFQYKITTNWPTWSRADHWRCDPHFKSTILTMLLMIKYSPEFSISRDLVDLIAGHLFNYHCESLVDQQFQALN